MRLLIMSFCMLWVGHIAAKDNDHRDVWYRYKKLVSVDQVVGQWAADDVLRGYATASRDSVALKKHREMHKKKIRPKGSEDTVLRNKATSHRKFKQVWESKQDLPSYRGMYITK